jgi:acetylornithine aminotransferase
VFHSGTHGSTFGGNPLVCKTALSVLEIIEKDKLLDNVAKMGTYLVSNFQVKLSNSKPVVGLTDGLHLI